MRFSLSPSRPSSPSALLLTTTFLALFTSRASAGFDFKVTADRCPQLNIQLTTGVLDGSTSATAFNLTIAKLPDLNSRVVPAPFYSAQIGLDNSALFFNKATDKGYFFNYSLGSQYSNQDIRSVLINATLLDTNNQPLKNIFGKEYLKGAFLDPLCRTSGTGNVNPTISGIPGFVTPSQTSTSSDGSAGTGESADNKGPDTKLIVGSVVGLVGGLISIIIVGVVFWRKRQVRLGKRQETANPYAADHMGSNAREWKPVN